MRTARSLILSAFALLPLPAAIAGTTAGDVLLAVGPVSIEAEGKQLPLVRGQQVEVGQKLVTRDGGHLHVRMKDGGLVAIRPNSELEIQVCDYDPAKPETGKVRYTLRQGVARSVTGAIGEANKAAFRFNTPIAAIGVRGTDFVTFSDNATTLVSVKSGAVVVSALSDLCRAEGFGACFDRAVALSAGDNKTYIEVTLQDKTPRLLQGNKLPDQISPPLPSEPVALLQDNRATKVSDTAKELQDAKPNVPLPPVTPTPPIAIEDGLKDVYWGRWKANAEGVTGATVAELLAAGKKIHIANPLFGLGVTQMPERLPELWQAQFQLTGGEAYVLANGAYSSATLAGGTLGINMASREFTAQANVKEGLNTHSIDAAGKVDVAGYLLSDPSRSNSTMYGAVNANLKTVGSVFEKSLTDGRSLTGSMIWQR